jgi:D-alanyl-D-alanine carboxypeptidase
VRPAIRVLLLLVVASVSSRPVTAQTQSVTRPALVTRLDSLTRAWVVNAPAAGTTVEVIRGSDTLLLEGVGQRDLAAHLPATTQTVYRIGSITKQFTAAAIMQLVERGRIGLNDPLSKYLPEYPQWRNITVRELLNHTSGIHSYTSVPAWVKTWNDELTPAQVVAFVAKDTLDFAPGTEWRYNNTGYVLLGMILDRVTGQSYPDYMRSHFFVPLGLRSASYCPSHATDPTYAAGYALTKGTIEPAAYLSMSHPYSAGALCMSVPDYLRWQTMLSRGEIVRPASYRMMSTSDTLTNGKPTNYGFGLFAGHLGTHREITHGGGINGFNTAQSWFPDDSLRVAVFANITGADPGQLASNLAAAVLGLPLRPMGPPPALVVSELTAANHAKYVGVYDMKTPTGANFPIHIEDDNGVLVSYAEGPGQGKFPLTYIGNDTFGAAFDPSLRLTILFENGKAARARLAQGGGTMEGARRP